MTKKGKCYTFNKVVHLGGEVYVKGLRIRLTKKQFPMFEKWIIPTEDYKGPITKDCGCK